MPPAAMADNGSLNDSFLSNRDRHNPPIMHVGIFLSGSQIEIEGLFAYFAACAE